MSDANDRRPDGDFQDAAFLALGLLISLHRGGKTAADFGSATMPGSGKMLMVDYCFELAGEFNKQAKNRHGSE